MYLSSRFAVCVGIAACFGAGTVGEALAARAAFIGGRPALVAHAPRPPSSRIAPTLVGRRDGDHGIRPALVSPFRRRGYRYGYDGFGYGGLGYGIGFDGYGVNDLGAAGGTPLTPGPIDAPPPFAFPAPPAPCPQIIEIGGGLAHKAATRVVSGSPCRR